MAYRRPRKFYIPITRSGSSMLASLIVQLLNQPRPETDRQKLSLNNMVVIFWIAFIFLCLLSMCTSGR